MRLLLAVAVVVLAVAGFSAAVAVGRPALVCHGHHCTTSTTTTTTPTTTGGGGTVEWRGDYETGDFSQWWLTQFGGASSGCGGPCGPAQVGNTSAVVETGLKIQGSYAARFTAQPCVSGCPNDRAEVLADQTMSGGFPGQEWYYGWWTYFPSGQSFWAGGGDWNDFTQFQGGGSVGGVEYLNVNQADYPAGQPEMQLEWSGRHDLGPLQFDHWYHFVVHARWAEDSTGIFQVYVDGTLKADLTGATMASSGVMEISQGYYSDASSNNVVYQDGLCRATSYAAAAGC